MHMKIKSQPGIALYYKIKILIQEAINKGIWKANEKIPNEIDLASSYGVSRATVRTAILELTREGILKRERGVGTFVVPPTFNTSINFEFRYPVEFGNKHEILEQKVIMPDKNMQLLYHISENIPLYKLTRSRYFKDSPVAIETIFFPMNRFPKIDTYPIYGRIFDFVIEKYHIRLDNFTIEIEPIILNSKQLKIFAIPKPAAGLVLTRVCHDSIGEVLLWHHSIFRGDCCKFLFK